MILDALPVRGHALCSIATSSNVGVRLFLAWFLNHNRLLVHQLVVLQLLFEDVVLVGEDAVEGKVVLVKVVDQIPEDHFGILIGS